METKVLVAILRWSSRFHDLHLSESRLMKARGPPFPGFDFANQRSLLRRSQKRTWVHFLQDVRGFLVWNFGVILILSFGKFLEAILKRFFMLNNLGKSLWTQTFNFLGSFMDFASNVGIFYWQIDKVPMNLSF